MINEKSLKALEYRKILNTVSTYAINVGAKKALAECLPLTDYAGIIDKLSETEASYKMLYEHSVDPIFGFESAAAEAARAKYGSMLTIPELLRIRLLCSASGRTKKAVAKVNDAGVAKISAISEKIHNLNALDEKIDSCIYDEETLRDSASPKLQRLRCEIISCKEKIKNKLTEYLKSAEVSAFLQDNLFTVRNGRYVLPVRAECRGAIAGLLHDISASGQTVYIEPMRIVELNNELRQLLIEENYEVERILQELSVEVGSVADKLSKNEAALYLLDEIFARARYSESIRGVKPIINAAHKIDIIKGRHPLIDKDKVVPIDVRINNNDKMLLISGPNTGGKTVTLKTVGLFCLMAAAGLFLPAASGSEVTVFQKIFCDIGDEQSIELSLSTFSSHMKNIASIAHEADSDSLVLLDELGAGTDPEEGAALAVGITEFLMSKACKTIITTHYSALKEFYLDTPSVVNASMEFDQTDLKPTYRLIMGIAGASNAIYIAQNLGVPEEIIQTAKSQISEEKRAFEGLLASAEARRSEAERIKRDTEETQRALSAELNTATVERERLFELRQNMQKSYQTEVRRAAQKAAFEASELIEEMKKLLADASEANLLKLKQMRNKLDELGYDNEYRKFNESPLTPPDIEMGMPVYVNSLGKSGKILSLPNKKSEVVVDVGGMTVTTEVSDLSREGAKKAETKATASFVSAKNDAPVMEINLLGQTVDEAVVNVERFIDNALMASVKVLRIVHGKGTGALRQGLHRYFRANRSIKEFRLGQAGEGSAGVTIITLA